MSKPRQSSLLKATVFGALLGAGAMVYRNHAGRKNPLNTPSQRRINRALDNSLCLARQKYPLSLEKTSRYVIFSDHHRGARDSADDFQPCEATYKVALDHYYEKDYTLILLGDVEELWENPIDSVMPAYEDIFHSEARFFPDRYFRVIGNHDNAWRDPELVAKYLDSLYPNINIYSSLLFEYDTGKDYGEIFLAHGHQGTLDADYFAGIAPQILPIYRQLQNKFNIGKTTPATDDFLRGEHDTQMYRWASQHNKLIFIAGHTHRPVWSSLTHLDQLYMQLYALRLRQKETEEERYEKEYVTLLNAIKKRIIKDPPVNDTLKTKPCYFNTGCCRFSDGDITCIEITMQTISLIKWDSRTLKRSESASMPLAELIALL